MKNYFKRWRMAACAGSILPWVFTLAAQACESANDQAFSSAYALIQSGKLGEARTQLESLLRPSPPRPEVLNNLAAVAHLQGDSAQALTWLEQAVTLMPPYASIRNNHALLSNKYLPNWSPLQLIKRLPCKQAQHTAMTMTEAIAHVQSSRKIDILEAAGPITLTQEQVLQLASANKNTGFFSPIAPLRKKILSRPQAH